MIERVDFKNYKALRDVSIHLERLTVLVGPSASGKTSTLEGLYHLCLVDRKPVEVQSFRDARYLRSILTRGAEEEVSLGCSGDQGGFRVSYSLLRYPVETEPGDKDAETVVSRMGGTLKDLSRLRKVHGMFVDYGPAVLLRLDVDALAAASYSEEQIPRLDSNGKGLASVLAYLVSNQREDFGAIHDSVRRIVPSVIRIRTPRAKVVRVEPDSITVDGKRYDRLEEREYWGNSIEFDMDGAPEIPAEMASEGALLVLGLLAAIMGPNPPRLVLLDDLDRSLHPKAQERLVGLLRELLKQNPDLQIVATSHSPYLLHHLKPEEVRLTALKDDGSVVCGRLDEHPEFEKWKEEMTPGEFWSVVGEKWLVEDKAGEAQ